MLRLGREAPVTFVAFVFLLASGRAFIWFKSRVPRPSFSPCQSRQGLPYRAYLYGYLYRHVCTFLFFSFHEYTMVLKLTLLKRHFAAEGSLDRTLAS